MKFIHSILLLILFVGISCKYNTKDEDSSKKTDSLAVISNRISNSIGETLIPSALEEVKNWKEYVEVDKFMLQFYSITPTEALSNAKELSTLVGQMKDSIRVEKFKELSVVSRLNVLHNQTLRLADMATISTITNEEVKDEVEKIVLLYGSLNAKINTIYKTEEIQNNLEFDAEAPIMEETGEKVLPKPFISPDKRNVLKKQ
ncbi:hypothetical protein [Lutibacter sp.]|uniref:hypothetical protein n=1 Tax=Lutibacter sp. TaxID=1925666 RepID=UPI002736F99D|nr:hypothetical protein [Lutibacter sp.]MDP3313623.1 hypothetical protein [Lutibacter sp.]